MYGFVRFGSSKEALEVANRCHGDFVWGRDLIVRPAARERNEAFLSKAEAAPKKTYCGLTNPVHWQHQQALSSKATKETNHPHHSASHKQLNFWAQFKQRVNRVEPRYEETANLVYTPKEIDQKWLRGCAVGYLSASKDIYHLQQHLLKLSIQCTIRYMGGRMVLLSFLGEELMINAMNDNSGWFEEHFDFIKPWDQNDIATSRYVWLKCENVPTNAWNVEFFKLVGDLYGKFEAVDTPTELKQRLDVGRILVHTPNLNTIDRKHRIWVDGKVVVVSVKEDTHHSFNPMVDMEYLHRPPAPRPTWMGETHKGREGDDVALEEGEIQISNSKTLPAIGANISASSFCSKNSLDKVGLNPSPINNPSLLVTTSSPTESIQVVPESPLDQLATVSPLNQPENEDQNHNAEGEIAADSVIEDEISLEEDYNEKLFDVQASQRVKKRVSKRKKLDTILGQCSGGKLLKRKLTRLSQKAKKKSNRRYKGKGKLIQPTEDVSSDIGDSLPGENIRNRNEEIHKAAAAAWALGQACGMSARREGDNVLSLFEDLEERDWDAYEKYQNE